MPVPDCCPVCGESVGWVTVDVETNKSGFSAGKAALGGILFGPIGLLGGALGKEHSYVSKYCKSCGFQHTYELK